MKIDYTDICPIFLNRDDNTFLRKHWRKRKNIFGKIKEDAPGIYAVNHTVDNGDGTTKAIQVHYRIDKSYLWWLHRWIPWAPSWLRFLKRLRITLRRKKIGIMYFYDPTLAEMQEAEDGSIIKVRPTHIKDAHDRIEYGLMNPFTFKSIADARHYDIMRKSLKEWGKPTRIWWIAIIILTVIVVVIAYYNGWLGYFGPPRP